MINLEEEEENVEKGKADEKKGGELVPLGLRYCLKIHNYFWFLKRI